MVSHAVGTSAGCVLFVKKLPGLEVLGHFSCESGRCALLDFSLNSTDWRIVCLYAPNVADERAQFFQGIQQRSAPIDN